MNNTGDIKNYIDELKTRLDLVEVIERDEPLTQKGREWRGTRNHSLQVSPDVGLWRDWGAAAMGGDAIRWVELHHNLPFQRAVEDLARMAGMQPPDWGHSDGQAYLAAQARYAAWDVAKDFFAAKRRECAAAARYCSRRGWAAESLDRLHIGYFDDDYAGLRKAFRSRGVDVYSPEAVALVGFKGDVTTWARGHDVDLSGRKYWVERGYIAGLPKHSLVFPHIEFGRVRYFSTRSVCLLREEVDAFVVWSAVTDEETRHTFSNEEERKAAKEAARKQGKRHYNLPRELTSERVPYWNAQAIPGRSDVVIVEGQADAITLEQWGVPAVALAGCQPDDADSPAGSQLLHQLAEAARKNARISAGTDGDDAGAKGTRKLAEIINPLLGVVQWPEHDANDWLQALAQERADPLKPTDDELKREGQTATEKIDAAHPYLLLWGERIGELNDHEKAPQLDALITALAQCTQAEIELLRKPLHDVTGLAMSAIDRMLKTKQSEDDDEDDAPPTVDSTAGGFVGGYLLEMLYVPPEDRPANAILLEEGKTLLAVRDPQGHVSVQSVFDVPGQNKQLRPLSPATSYLHIGTVILPPRVGKLLPVAELIEKIRAMIHKYVDVSPFYESLASYYVLFTWFYDIFPTLSYLRIKGDAGTGKTRFIEVAGSLCYRPLLMNAGASVSAIFRTLDRVRGTLVLDEGDFTKSDESADIAKLLNVGNQRKQGYISRTGSKENDFEPEFFFVYGPKVISTRKKYQDNAIESRCLTHETGTPTTRDDIPQDLPDSFWTEEVPEMQSLLLAYRMHHWSQEINQREIPLDLTIERRIQQVTNSLRKMIDDPKMETELKEFIRQYNAKMIEARSELPEAKVLEALCIAWETQHKTPEDRRVLSMSYIAEITNDLIDFENEVPIDRWKRYKDTAKNKITARGVGKWVERLQLESYRPGWDNTRRRHILWDAERIPALWQRYGLDGEEARSRLLTAWYEAVAMVQERKEALDTALHRPPSYTH